MNVHISYKVRKTPDIEKDINHLVEKLRKRLQVFRPELVHLKRGRRTEFTTRGNRRIAEPASAVGANGGTEISPKRHVRREGSL